MPPRISPFKTPVRQASKLCFRPQHPLKSFSSSVQRHRPEDSSDNGPDLRPQPRRGDVSPSVVHRQTSRRSPASDLSTPPRDTGTASAINAAFTNTTNPASRTAGERLTSILERNYSRPAPRVNTRKRRAEMNAAQQRNSSVENLMSRVWRDGDVYSPHDLSPVEMSKAREGRTGVRSGIKAPPVNTRSRRTPDVLDELGIDPRLEYKNPAFIGSFVSETGRIKHPQITQLRAVNQRKMAKAVRRAMAMAILPTVHRHPELHPQRMAQRGQVENRSR